MIKAINVSVKKIIFETLNIKSDTIGAFARGLCMVHCLATPFFFIAIKQASKSSTKHWVVQGLWFSWLTLFFLILNIKLELLHLPPNFKFFPAFMLVFLHVYNMRYCQCEKDCC